MRNETFFIIPGLQLNSLFTFSFALSADNGQFNTCPRKQKRFMDVSPVSLKLTFILPCISFILLFISGKMELMKLASCFFINKEREEVTAPSTQSHNGETSESICWVKTYKNKSTSCTLRYFKQALDIFHPQLFSQDPTGHTPTII